ncbi:MAG TPA: PPOX class F420-dependent oxidoreductase [Pseudonocardia sp.]|jgi:PPOX class probable F420-dependent enzyme|uniref:PPOX class F420-dependent oxidoreductase n=1 Tax=Pseudonocardia sp. TaxID=60912 RepID=UPI002F3F3FC9
MAELSAEVVAFLSEGTRTGKVGYVAADGRPLVAPVWFLVQDGQVVFNTGKDSAKGRAFARDSRVVLCVDDERPPFGFVQIQGEVRLSEDPDELLDTAVRLGTRYMGEQRGAEFGRRNAVPGELVVWLRPTKVLAAFNMAE